LDVLQFEITQIVLLVKGFLWIRHLGGLKYGNASLEGIQRKKEGFATMQVAQMITQAPKDFLEL